MINEPAYWKRGVAQIASELAKCQTQRRWREGSYAKLEKLLMLGFYSVRKLIESQWVDLQMKHESVVAIAFPCRKIHVYRGSHQDVAEVYNLKAPSPRRLPLEFICNQIVHSFVFTPAFCQHRLVALYFCSFEKRSNVLRVEIAELIRVLRKASTSRHHVFLRFSAEVNRLDEP
jgi:hypothetical protein